MNDYAQQIKDRVTMADILNYYGFRLVAGRMPCPFHNGKDSNFSARNRSYRCWVCGEHGDVITFVQRYFGLDFQSALAKINTDLNLGLPIGEKIDQERQREANRIAYERRKELERRKKRHQTLQKAYDDALSSFATLDKSAENLSSEVNLCGLEGMAGPDLYNIALDGISDETAYAVTHIDEAAYRMYETASDLAEYEREMRSS